MTTTTDTRLYGAATARAWDRLHPRLTHRSAWTSQTGPLPLIEGTVIRLQVERLPSGAIPKPVWLWYSGVDLTASDVDYLWHGFLRRFDIEHTFRLSSKPSGGLLRKHRKRRTAGLGWSWLPIPTTAGSPADGRPAPPMRKTR